MVLSWGISLLGQGSVKGGLQADGVQRDPAGAHVLVGPQQVGAAIGTHAVALAEVAIGIGQGLVGTGHPLGGTDGRDAQLGTTGAEVGHHFLQGGGNGIGGGCSLLEFLSQSEVEVGEL